MHGAFDDHVDHLDAPKMDRMLPPHFYLYLIFPRLPFYNLATQRVIKEQRFHCDTLVKLHQNILDNALTKICST